MGKVANSVKENQEECWTELRAAELCSKTRVVRRMNIQRSHFQKIGQQRDTEKLAHLQFPLKGYKTFPFVLFILFICGFF